MTHAYKVGDQLKINGRIARIASIDKLSIDVTWHDGHTTSHRAHELDALHKADGGFQVGDIFTRPDGSTLRITFSNWLSYQVYYTAEDGKSEAGSMTHSQILAWHLGTASIPFVQSVEADPDLTATAQEIKRLQSIIDDQRQQLVRANARTEAAEAARNDYLERLDTITEKYKTSQILLEGIVAPKSREVCTLVQSLTMTGQRINADKELAERLNEGWEVLNITVINAFWQAEAQEVFTRVVTLSRECPVPHKKMPTGQHDTIIIQPAPFPSMEPAPAITAHHRFTQMKAESDARVEAAAPYSPLTMAVVNYLKVGL